LTNAAGFGIGSVTVNGGGSDYDFNNINSGFSFQVSPAVTSVFNITNIVVPGYTCTPALGTSANVVVTQLNPTISVISNYNGFDVSCENTSNGIASVAVNGTPPYQYAWSNGATTSTAANLPPGTGGVTVTDANNCTESAPFFLDAPPAILFELSNTEPTCFGETNATITVDTVFGGFAPYYVSFDEQLAFPLPDEGFTYTNLGAGQYDVTVLDGNNCSVTVPVFIPAPEELLVNIGVDTTIELGDSLTLVLQSNFDPGQITWSTLNGPFATDTLALNVGPLYETTYIVDVIDTVTGCVATHRITVKISKERKVYIPTVFSPNGDSNNDIFYIFADPKIIQTIPVFRIYDRWGAKVFEQSNFPPNDPVYGFDGFHRGNLMMPQVLTYYIEVLYIDGRRQFFEGDVTLMR
jgi:gliding motility-associated-like protein